MSEPGLSTCDIRQVGLARNGRPRFWCTAHKADATGRGGASLAACKGDRDPQVPRRNLDLDPAEFPGGLAIWGSVPPIYNTTRLAPEQGVHVHARRLVDGEKDIDGTFDEVSFPYQRDLVQSGRTTINGDAAVAYYLSRFVGHRPECLFCTYCGNPHIDEGEYAIRPHRRHLCHSCGRFFTADAKGVSNPLSILADLNSAALRPRDKAEVSALSIAFDQQEYAGGIQLWSSNPAIVWTADKPELSGIHVHAYDGNGVRQIDDTYGEVWIDGVAIPPWQVAYLMAQNAHPELAGRIRAISCTQCGAEAFDQGSSAFTPTRHRVCGGCGSVRQEGAPVVANPLVAVLESLQGKAAEGIDEGIYLHHGHWH